MKKFVLGISGFIGSGKTTVSRLFEELGAYFIDADVVVDDLYSPGGAGIKKIQNFFGNEYILNNGSLNRKKLAKVVFADPKKLRILNTLIHPLVTAEVQKILDKVKSNFIVLEATYFEKKQLLQFVSALLWVECNAEKAYLNIQNSRKMDPVLFKNILSLQVMPSQIDYVVRNSGNLDDLRLQVVNIYNHQIKPRL